jgi:hypothetical protein
MPTLPTAGPAIDSLGVELVIQINATLYELAANPRITVSEKELQVLTDVLHATKTALGSRHFSGDAKHAINAASSVDPDRRRTAGKALESADHWLRVLQQLHGPQPVEVREVPAETCPGGC